MMLAAGLRKRMAWTALALVPALAATLALHPGRAIGLLLALLAGLVIETAALRLRGLPVARLRDDPGLPILVAVTWLWLGAVADAPAYCVLAAALAAAMRACFGGTGQSPFHPAAFAVAATLALDAAPGAALSSTWPALALLAGAVVMLARRLLALPTLAGWGAGLLLGSLLAGSPLAGLDLFTAMLVGAFVLDDGGSAGIRAGPRFVVTLSAGLLGATLGGPAAMAAAVLLANFLAPAIESAWPGRQPA